MLSMPDYRAILTEGMIPGNLTKSLMLTDAGVQGSGKRWFGRSKYDEARAADVFGQTLRNSAISPFKGKRNPYVQTAATTYYHNPSLHNGLNGISDEEPGFATDPYPTNAGGTTVIAAAPSMAPQPSGGSSSGWGDVLQSTTKTLVGGIASGLTNLIGGRPNTTIMAPASSGPSLMSMILIGGAIAVPLFLILRRKS